MYLIEDRGLGKVILGENWGEEGQFYLLSSFFFNQQN